MAPTKDELEAENAELTAEVERLRAEAAEREDTRELTATGDNPRAPRPQRPDYLSAGEAADLEANGVTVSPFTGETLNALTEGVEPGTPEARHRAERELARTESAPVVNQWPISGAPPAEGGDTDATRGE